LVKKTPGMIALPKAEMPEFVLTNACLSDKITPAYSEEAEK